MHKGFSTLYNTALDNTIYSHQVIDFVSQWIDKRSPLLGKIFADMVPPQVFLEAHAQAKHADVTLLDALLARPDVPVEAIVRRLALRSKISIIDTHDIDFKKENIPASHASLALRAGILHLKDGRMIVALRGKALERALPLLRKQQGDLRKKIFLASPRDFAALIMQLGGTDMAQDAENTTKNIGKHLSAQSTGLIRIIAIGLIALVGYSIWQGNLPLWASLCFSTFFILLALMRFYACIAFLQTRQEGQIQRIADHDLPVYTLLIPLFKEARVVEKLVNSVCLLDYPAAKLDIKFLVEAEDKITQETLDKTALRGNMEVLVVPKGKIRTKPRALNIGLMAARGQYVAVYDAEDEPDKGQLRAALSAFTLGDKNLACVQGHLTIDNTQDGWITRHFTLEYTALFEILLPALARFKVLFPLGGTSNHFKTSVLRECGGWDAYNVTEDADLGARLGRRGYHLGMITSATWEEAPNRGISWLTQRTRWMKGYMITWGVHMRTPLALWNQLGWKNFLIFQGFIAGMPLVALAFPVFLVLCAIQGFSGNLLREDSALHHLHLFALLFGFCAAFVIILCALLQRSLWSLWHAPFTLIFYWLCVSFAAWRALVQLLYSPHFWEKTEHGYARTSRLKIMRNKAE